MKKEELNQKVKKRQIFNRGFLTGVIISFFLPFVTVSCDNIEVLELSGVNLVRGKTIMVNYDLVGDSEEESIPANWRAILALLSAIVGLLISFIKKENSTAPTVSSGLGSILLLMLKFDLEKKAREEVLDISFGLGFWLAFFLFLSAAVINGWGLYHDKISNSGSKKSDS
jgi:hypothetical protein